MASTHFDQQETNLKWAAQMLTHRGSVTSSADRITLEVTDHDASILNEFRIIVGCGTVAGPLYRDGSQPFYRWRAGAAHDVEMVVDRLRPHLSPDMIARATRTV